MVTNSILTRKSPSRSTLPPPELERVEICQPSTLPWTRNNVPPSIVITLNIQAAKPSPLLTASALVIALAVAIAVFSAIVERVIIVTADSLEEADAKPLVIESKPGCDSENTACSFGRSRTKLQEFI